MLLTLVQSYNIRWHIGSFAALPLFSSPRGGRYPALLVSIIQSTRIRTKAWPLLSQLACSIHFGERLTLPPRYNDFGTWHISLPFIFNTPTRAKTKRKNDCVTAFSALLLGIYESGLMSRLSFLYLEQRPLTWVWLWDSLLMIVWDPRFGSERHRTSGVSRYNKSAQVRSNSSISRLSVDSSYISGREIALWVTKTSTRLSLYPR